MFDALSRLPEQQRIVVALHHVGGLTLAQVADEEHLPLEAVTPRLASGYQALAQWTGQTTQAHRDSGRVDPVQSWAAVEPAELAHALSYRTDRRAVDQVFRHAIRNRVAVTAATAAAVSIGLGGALAVTQRAPLPYDVALPPASAPGTPSPFPADPGDAYARPPPVLGPLSVPGLLPRRQPTAGQDDSPVPTSSVTTLDIVNGSPTGPPPAARPRPDSGEPGYPAAASPRSTQVTTPDQSPAMSTRQPSSAGRGGRGLTDRATSASRSAGDSTSGGHSGGRGGGHASGHSSGEGGYSSGRSSAGHSSGDSHSSDSHSGGDKGHGGGGHSGGGHFDGGGGRGR
jgi:hypothetical protein